MQVRCSCCPRICHELHVIANTGMQLQRAHAVTELSRDLKQAVAKAKKRRLKQAAGSPRSIYLFFRLDLAIVALDACSARGGVTRCFY